MHGIRNGVWNRVRLLREFQRDDGTLHAAVRLSPGRIVHVHG